MSDFTLIQYDINSGASDASPTWTHILFGAAGYELRCDLTSGASTTSTASASWPSILKPASGTTLITKRYGFTADTTGFVVTGGDGTGSHYMTDRINWDATGTFASGPVISAWANNTYPAASPGTQGTADGSAFVNGTAAESSSTSLIKATAYGYGVDTGGTQQTPGSNMGSNPVATSGSAGAVSPATGAWNAYQSLQAATQWIADAVTPKATTAGFWYFLLMEYIAAGMTGGTLVPVIGFQYTYI